MEPWKDVNEDAFNSNLAHLAAQSKIEMKLPVAVHPEH